MTPHSGNTNTCPACAEIRAMMKNARSFETKGALLALLKEEQAKYHAEAKK